MGIEASIYAIQAADGPLTALVPATRIKPPGNWEDLERPYIVHFATGETPTHTFSGLAGFQDWGYQISVFADSAVEAAAIVATLRNSFGDKHFSNGIVMFWEGARAAVEDPDPNIVHIPVMFRVILSD